jgi:hypothetical protein
MLDTAASGSREYGIKSFVSTDAKHYSGFNLATLHLCRRAYHEKNSVTHLSQLWCVLFFTYEEIVQKRSSKFLFCCPVALVSPISCAIFVTEAIVPKNSRFSCNHLRGTKEMVLTGHVQYNGQKRFEDGKYV